MRVEVLAVGTELLLGQVVNSNAAVIGTRLAEAGLDHYRQSVVGDNLGRITEVLAEACSRADALIITGGLGPTQDDLTREALQAVAGVKMAFSEEYAARLGDWWRRRGREMPASNLRQAEYPVGAVLIPNERGSAPGLEMRIGSCRVFALPGVPQEMVPMLERHVVPSLLEAVGEQGTVIVSRLLRTWGEPESALAERLDDLYEGGTNPTLAFLASAGEIKLRLTARAHTREAAVAAIAPVEEEIRSRLGPLVFGVDDEMVEAVVLQMCRDKGWRLATAESVTGGLVAAALTAVPGASEVFTGSVVAYSPSAKEDLLGVGPELIGEAGQVSEEVAVSMAEGAARRFGVEAAVAVTGSAGPEPLEEPPGTVVVGVVTPEDGRARTLHLPGDRERVRAYAATAALHLLRLGVSGAWWRS